MIREILLKAYNKFTNTNTQTSVLVEELEFDSFKYDDSGRDWKKYVIKSDLYGAIFDTFGQENGNRIPAFVEMTVSNVSSRKNGYKIHIFNLATACKT